MVLWGVTFCYSFVVCGTEYAKIEGAGVAADFSDVLEVCFVGAHFVGNDVFESDVVVGSVAHEAVEGCLVVLLGTVLSVFCQLRDEGVHELE